MNFHPQPEVSPAQREPEASPLSAPLSQEEEPMGEWYEPFDEDEGEAILAMESDRADYDAAVDPR